jgi:hypothetical protein
MSKKDDRTLATLRHLFGFGEEYKHIIFIDEAMWEWKIIPLDGSKPETGTRLSDLILTLTQIEKVSLNPLEARVMELLEKASPGQWVFTGDGGGKLGRFTPDFVSFQGHILEFDGSHWHEGGKSSERKRPFYESEGFRLLVISNTDLKNEPALIEKLRRFHES